MISRISRGLRRAALAVVLAALAAAPAAAANKEHQQLAADIRMLQEQAQQLQNLLGQLTESIKAVNARLDEQAAATRKSFADEKLIIDNLSSDLRVVREKVDDNNVRISSLAQELDQIRQMVQVLQSSPRPTGPDVTPPPAAGAPPAAGSTPPTAPPAAGTPTTGTTTAGPAPTTPTAPATPPPAATVGASPQQLFDMAWSDYAAGQYDLAITGFDSYIRSFPKSDMADDAQVLIGAAYVMKGDNQKAVEAFDTAIRTYPNGDKIPDAYFRKGVALQSLKQMDAAREAFQTAATKFPDSDAGRLAKQRLQQMSK